MFIRGHPWPFTSFVSLVFFVANYVVVSVVLCVFVPLW